MILSARASKTPVCGIAGHGVFSMLNIEKTLMNKERSFGRRVLTVLEEQDVSWEHLPTGIDTMSVIIRDTELKGKGESLIGAIQRRCDPDEITLTSGLAMVATVGQGMNHHVGIAARLTGALAAAGVNLRVIDQGSSEMNIIIGVEEADLNTAIKAIYAAFAE